MKKPEHARPSLPVTIPHVVLDVHEDGTLTVTIDGEPLSPPEWAPPWRRSSFPQIIDQASHDRTVPVRVEVREADGAVFTDLITARQRRAEPKPLAVPAPKSSSPLPVFHTIEGAGFVPGEDVAVAIITGYTDAAHTGDARALIDLARPIPDPSGGTIDVLLLGRISGNAVVRRLP